MMKTFILKFLDLVMAPVSVLAAKYFRFVRHKGVSRLTTSRAIFRKTGVFPVTNHYYDPMPNVEELKELDSPNFHPAIFIDYDWIFTFCEKLMYKSEIDGIDFDNTLNDGRQPKFPFFLPQEAELYYLFIRNFKPETVLEVGAGFSTKIAQLAVGANNLQTLDKPCRLVCIEPFENEWLEQTDAEIIRKKIEDCDIDIFTNLKANDILFIDTSHQIKPEGDVLTVYSKILPKLQSGVIVQIHDIFYPRNYPKKWLVDAHSFWNEQYLLEAFLAFNNEFDIVFPQNHLFRDYTEKMRELFLTPSKFSDWNAGPCSLWMKRK